MKITISLENSNNFGGINLVSNEFNLLNLSQISNKQLGCRSPFSQHSNSDIFKNT
jgi:hypothetical protein